MSDDQLRRFSVSQRAAVASAFNLAGCGGELLVAPIASEDERAFLLEPATFRALGDRVAPEQILTQLLGHTVWIAAKNRMVGEAECGRADDEIRARVTSSFAARDDSPEGRPEVHGERHEHGNGKVVVNRSMSLDGFTAGPGDSMNWIFDFMGRSRTSSRRSWRPPAPCSSADGPTRWVSA